MPEYPRGTVAFLFTDIEGSTRRWETHQEAMREAVGRHFALLEQSVAGHGGVVFKTIGDAVQAAFSTAPHAIAAAIAAQDGLENEDWGALGPLRVRMAVHVGEATPHDGDYLAPSLNRLARLLAVGHGEQVLVSETARSLVAGQLPAGYDLRDLGSHRLRDLLAGERIFQLVGPGLRADFPPPKSLDVHPHNLPAQPTPLIGRETEVQELHRRLSAHDTRLLTLTGPGGTGKTRLALQAAAESLDAFPDGVWWAPLATVSDPALVADAIANALGVREAPGEPLVTTLVNHLGSRQTLLLLDNMEHLVDAAPLIATLLDASPGLVVLVTSREPLQLRAEREIPVEPLALPTDAPHVSLQDALASPAVRLFLERAQAVKPGFAVDAGNVADVLAICRRLDGLPLAIELAAARVRMLPPASLLARLDRRLAILTGGARDLPERQQTLRAAIAWSHDLLQPREQALFARLAVFAGGCTFDAAEAVHGAGGGVDFDLIDGLESLIQKSLLRQQESANQARYTMLETIREFAQERFQTLPDAAAIREAHANAFLHLAEQGDWDDFSGQAALLERLEADRANLLLAIAYYEEQGEAGLGQRVRMASALTYFWWVRGHIAEGRRVLDAAIEAHGDVPSQECVNAISGAALLAEAQGDLERAEVLHEQALRLRRESADAVGIATSLTGLGVIARQRGELALARARHQEALAAWRQTSDVSGTAGALLDLGLIRVLEGEYDRAEPELQESLSLFRTQANDTGEAIALQHLGLLATATGDFPRAIDRLEESLKRWRDLGNQPMIATDLANLAEARHLSGDLNAAQPLYAEALALFESMDDPNGRGFVLSQTGLLALERGEVNDARRLLGESLSIRWNAGLRGSVADTLEAMTEAAWQTGDVDEAARLLQAANQLRAETGLARLPVYEKRYARTLESIEPNLLSREPIDVGATVEMAIDAFRPALAVI